MSTLKLLGKLLEVVTKAGAVVENVEQVVRRISGRPAARQSQPSAAPHEPPPSTPAYAPPYQDEHCWTRFGSHLPPQTCIWCKQLRTRASRYCPGIPKDM